MTQARHIRVTGLVQGVGFRPFVWRLANELDLRGWVRNDAAGVEIAAEGHPEQLEQLIHRLREDAPPLARVEQVHAVTAPACGSLEFVIAESGRGEVTTAIGHDTGLCAACLEELFTPGNRRWRHAFITCTHCGPRYTVSQRLPYDRANTSLAPFPLCADCAAEYESPADRRFHAETTCCPQCGPQLQLLDAKGKAIEGDAIAQTLALLKQGNLVAIKGLGGFHLACDARNADAVARLRERKHREEKPFAVMAANVASLTGYAECSEAAATLLQSNERPIVLLPKTAAELEGIAPGLRWLGAMLPATPIQWLLFHKAAGQPTGMDWLNQPQELLLVMTSANPGGEPLVIANDEALSRLAGIADAFLLHDRDIVARCDDSLLRPVGDTVRPERPTGTSDGRSAKREVEGQPTKRDHGASTSEALLLRRAASPCGTLSTNGATFQFLRRARGYTPRPIKLPNAGPSVLALGAGLKNTICVTHGNEAFISAHIGDLDNAATCAFLEETVHHLIDILQAKPQAIACDLHPDFHSTRLAHALAEEWRVPLIQVQHHHAHIAAIAAEHGHQGPLLGLALDGVGLGSDGAAWGGELLRLEGADFTRLGHLHPLPLPGGDKAAREPWRMGAAVFHRLGRRDEIAQRFAAQPLASQLALMLDKQLNSPLTSSLGRIFDAAAALLGLQPVASFEGQAAMLLEGCAASHIGDAPLWHDGWSMDNGILDLLPLLARLADWQGGREEAAAAFHRTLAAALADWVKTTAPDSEAIALGGGCFLNAVLTRHLTELFSTTARALLTAHAVPPNDGGIALGQAWIARQQLLKEH
ncbi:MAG TPA: carbamoyltransferase HypF [Rhodocyclaceae bacterium]|nr:carbamoyltransferase HypF [Rhodocyclaceae bacterium]